MLRGLNVACACRHFGTENVSWRMIASRRVVCHTITSLEGANGSGETVYRGFISLTTSVQRLFRGRATASICEERADYLILALRTPALELQLLFFKELRGQKRTYDDVHHTDGSKN